MEKLSFIKIDKKNEFLVNDFIQEAFFVQKHIDWLSIDEILQSEGIAAAIYDHDKVEAFISLEQKSDKLFWIHSFLVNNTENASHYLKFFIESAFQISFLPCQSKIFAIPLSLWFENALWDNNFHIFDSLVSLSCEIERNKIIQQNNLFGKISPLEFCELDETYEICEKAFPKLWQLSKLNFSNAAINSKISLKAVNQENQICGYLLSQTYKSDSIHISRLAVEPNSQFHGIGMKLLSEFIKNAFKEGFSRVSVNTQKSNAGAINLYKKIGFISDLDESFVYQL